MAHHIDRVDLRFLAIITDRLRLNAIHHGIGNLVTTAAPSVDHLIVFFLLGDQAVLVLLLIIGNQRLGLIDQFVLFSRDNHVILAEGNAGLERVAEAKHHDRVSEQHSVLLASVAIYLVDNVADVLLGEKAVDDVKRNLVVLR